SVGDVVVHPDEGDERVDCHRTTSSPCGTRQQPGRYNSGVRPWTPARGDIGQARRAESCQSGREIDAHHHAPGAWAAYLGEAGLGEDLAAADVQLTPDDLLAGMGDHRVGLQGSGAIFPGEVDRGRGQRVADAALAVPLAGHEAGDRPDAGVRLVLVAAAPDRPD